MGTLPLFHMKIIANVVITSCSSVDIEVFDTMELFSLRGVTGLPDNLSIQQ